MIHFLLGVPSFVEGAGLPSCLGREMAAQSVPHTYAVNVILKMTLTMPAVINEITNHPFLDDNALTNQKYRL